MILVFATRERSDRATVSRRFAAIYRYICPNLQRLASPLPAGRRIRSLGRSESSPNDYRTVGLRKVLSSQNRKLQETDINTRSDCSSRSTADHRDRSLMTTKSGEASTRARGSAAARSAWSVKQDAPRHRSRAYCTQSRRMNATQNQVSRAKEWRSCRLVNAAKRDRDVYR